MTTHDLDEAGGADHVLLLASRVVAQGPPREVLSGESLSEAYGVRIVELGQGPVLDDPHHQGARGRHVHFDRTGHADHGED
jgi:manganese transport system ATP-binding protein